MNPRWKYSPIEKILNNVEEPYRSSCLKILSENRKLFQTVQGSANNHQAWPGGYFDHLQEVLNIAAALYPFLDDFRLLHFTLSEALVALFFHDIEKPWKYVLGEDGQLHVKPELVSKEAQHAYKMKKIKEYGIELTPEIENAIKYAEGELSDYSFRRRVMSPLAAFCHMCDVCSARIWFDCPPESPNPWSGGRIRDAS